MRFAVDSSAFERSPECRRGLVVARGATDQTEDPALEARLRAVAALVKRVVKWGAVPFIDQLVALMNVVSLENLVPCGGDGLHGVGDELVLRPAAGREAYRLLGRPALLEQPDPGELVALGTGHGAVLCRGRSARG